MILGSRGSGIEQSGALMQPPHDAWISTPMVEMVNMDVPSLIHFAN